MSERFTSVFDGEYHQIHDGDRRIACCVDQTEADRIVDTLSASQRPEQAGSSEIERLLHITESLARWLDDDGDTCNRGNPDGGGIYPCDHCTIKEMVTEADAAIAALAQPARGEALGDPLPGADRAGADEEG